MVLIIITLFLFKIYLTCLYLYVAYFWILVENMRVIGVVRVRGDIRCLCVIFIFGSAVALWQFSSGFNIYLLFCRNVDKRAIVCHFSSFFACRMHWPEVTPVAFGIVSVQRNSGRLFSLSPCILAWTSKHCNPKLPKYFSMRNWISSDNRCVAPISYFTELLVRFAVQGIRSSLSSTIFWSCLIFLYWTFSTSTFPLHAVKSRTLMF